jgi:uncharacterized membrane protein YesL
MEKVLNPFYRVLEIITQFLVLNLLWILFCLPIVTIFSSTLAMFGVVRKWVTDDFNYTVFKPFINNFKGSLKQGIVFQAVWTIIAAVLIVDFRIVYYNDFLGKQAVWTILLLGIVIFTMMSFNLFPIMAHYQLSMKDLLKNALLMSIGSLGNTVLSIVSFISLSIIAYYFPILLLFYGSGLAFIIYQIYNRSLLKMKIKNNRPEKMVSFLKISKADKRI